MPPVPPGVQQAPTSTLGMRGGLVKSFHAQKAEVKRGMQEDVTDKKRWSLIEMKWFDRWKAYVNFDSTGDGGVLANSESTNPGEIDNSSLCEEHNELRKDIVENVDFVLMPEKVAATLFEIFGGGPRLDRNVFNHGTIYAPSYKIDFYPIRFQCKCVTNSAIEEDMLYFSEEEEVDSVTDKIRKKFKVRTDSRFWIRLGKSGSVAATVKMAVDGEPVRRKLTADVTDVVDGYRLVRGVNKAMRVANLLLDKIFVELLLEVGTVELRLGPSISWPWCKNVNAWRDDLQIGDLVDAESSDHTWREAEIIAADAMSVKVHFRGFGTEEDVSVDQDKVFPLYIKSKNWRDELTEDSPVDVKYNGRWVEGTVVEVDAARETVQVRIAIDNSNDDVSIAGGAAFMETSDDSMEVTDDRQKQLSASFPTTCAALVAVDADSVVRPFDLDSEELCEAHTHTPKRALSLSYNTSTYMYPSASSWAEKHTRGTPPSAGATGLKNLGNTCFMNSIMQCLSNTGVLTEAFISNRYKDQVNTDNPLGHGGKLAHEFAKVIKLIWGGAHTVVTPREFKDTIGEFQPQFAGYQQQDSQELLAFLLDGLHEDLNRVKKKQSVATIESNGRPDALIASESWRRFLLRNDSEIVDNCFGQYRSHLTCTSCGYESVTFDPYNVLTLPIPVKQKKTISLTVHLYPYDQPPVKMSVDVSIFGTVFNLKQKVIEVLLGLKLVRGEDSPSASSDESYEKISGYACEDVDNGSVLVRDKCMKSHPFSPHSDKNLKRECAISELYSKSTYEAVIADRSITLSTNPHCLQVMTTGYNKRTVDSHQAVSIVNGEAVVFQLEYPCPSKAFYTPYSGETYMTTVDVTFARVREAPNYAAVSIGTVSPTFKADFYGHPLRLAVTVDITNIELMRIVWRACRRFAPTESITAGDCGDVYPFVLMLASSYGSIKPDPILIDNEICNLSAMDGNTLCIVWRIEPAGVDDQFSATRVLLLKEEEALESPLTVYKCIEKFNEREQLGEDDAWYCPRCKQHRVPVKKLDLWSTPDILVLHLKRFLFVPGQYFVHREKITDHVDFPIEGLDLSDHILGPINKNAPPLYDLYGVSLHSGGLGGGHYTAVCRNHQTNEWFNFDDSFVSKTTPETAINGCAYVLFYKRRASEPLKWGGIMPLAGSGLNDESNLYKKCT